MFSADRKASEYRSLLEITPGRARLLTPAKSARLRRWVLSVSLFIPYAAWAGSLLVFVFGPVMAYVPPWGWFLMAGMIILAAALLVLLLLWWDRASLLLLADEWTESTDLTLLAARSFGTYQDVRARAPGGEELHLVVDAREPRFWQAVGLLQNRPASSG